MEGCCERNFLKPSLNSTEFSLATSEDLEHFHIFSHLLSMNHNLQPTAIIYCSCASVQCSSASCAPSHLVAGDGPRGFQGMLHLASSDISDSTDSNAKHASIVSVCFSVFCLSVQSFSYLLPIGRLFIIVLVTSVPKTEGY